MVSTSIIFEGNKCVYYGKMWACAQRTANKNHSNVHSTLLTNCKRETYLFNISNNMLLNKPYDYVSLERERKSWNARITKLQLTTNVTAILREKPSASTDHCYTVFTIPLSTFSRLFELMCEIYYSRKHPIVVCAKFYSSFHTVNEKKKCIFWQRFVFGLYLNL